MANRLSHPAQGTDQWYLEVNGKKFGPYTMAQVQGLVQHKEILAEDKVTAPHLEGKWITVQEFVHKASEPTSPAGVPPRPDERTLTSITLPSTALPVRNTKSDPVVDLFEILQASRDRSAQKNSAALQAPHVVGSPEAAKPFPWMVLAFPVVGIVGIWGALSFFSASSPAPTEAAQEPAAKKIARAKPMVPAAPVPPPAVAVSKPKPAPARPAIIISKPSTATAREDAARERDRELARERDREMERERDREQEMARDSGDERSRELEREQERDRERELRSNRGIASEQDPGTDGSQDPRLADPRLADPRLADPRLADPQADGQDPAYPDDTRRDPYNNR